MNRAIKILLLTLCLVCAADGQNRRGVSMEEMLAPHGDDIVLAQSQGFEVFKILPRGIFDYEKNEMSLRGGGAYYSFTNQSHSYNKVPQIELQKANLSVAFYGANYGFIRDLGKVSFSEINLESDRFLANYEATTDESTARSEYQKAGKGFEIEGVKYNQSVAAIVGNAYILRAISYREADALVAFQIHRKEADGSLVVFWKWLDNFEKPLLLTQSK